MELKIKDLLRYVRLENGFLIIGGVSLVTSIFVKYESGLKISLVTLIFASILRFYNLTVVKGIINVALAPKSKSRKTLVLDEETGLYKESYMPYVPLKYSLPFEMVDLTCCLSILGVYAYVIFLLFS